MLVANLRNNGTNSIVLPIITPMVREGLILLQDVEVISRGTRQPA
jgi:hypothetical protein